MRSLRELLVVETQDMHAGETLLADSLKRLVESARDGALQRALSQQRSRTDLQIARLEQALARLGTEPAEDVCEAMEGIVAQAEEAMEDDLPGHVMDAALFSTALKISFFEVASYRVLIDLAEGSGEPGIAALMRSSLEEEQESARTLEAIGAANSKERTARHVPIR